MLRASCESSWLSFVILGAIAANTNLRVLLLTFKYEDFAIMLTYLLTLWAIQHNGPYGRHAMACSQLASQPASQGACHAANKVQKAASLAATQATSRPDIPTCLPTYLYTYIPVYPCTCRLVTQFLVARSMSPGDGCRTQDSQLTFIDPITTKPYGNSFVLCANSFDIGFEFMRAVYAHTIKMEMASNCK